MQTIQNCKFNISDDLEVNIWLDEHDENTIPPFLYQPHHPDGAPFNNKQDAEEWAINFINERYKMENELVIE